MNATLRRFVLFLLHIALIVAMWTTALARLSERPNAVALLTGIGTQVVNPALSATGTGVDQAAYAQLQQMAQASPSAPLPLPGLKAQVLGSDILGLSFADGTRVIYSKAAAAYYDGGPNAAFDLPALPTGFTNIFSDYGALANFVKAQNAPVTLPQLPTGVLGFVGHLGLSPSTLTAAEHQTLTNIALFAWLAALLLGLLVVLVSRRWGRISSVAWAAFNTALPGVILLGLAALIVSRNPAPLAKVSGLLGTIGDAFIPVYVGAAAAGVAGLVLSGVLRLATRQDATARTAYVVQPAAAPPLPTSAPLRGAPQAPWREQYPSAPYADNGPADPNADTIPF